MDDSILKFTGPAKVYESQDDAVEAILGGKVVAGDVVVIRYEGPKGGPGMQEMLYPTTFLKSMGLGKACALITDGRFSGGTSGLSIGHVSQMPSGGNIAIIEDGDMIAIDIPNRGIQLQLSDAEIAARREAQEVRGDKAWTPKDRQRQVSFALRAYASLATSADKGAVRDKSARGIMTSWRIHNLYPVLLRALSISERYCVRRYTKSGTGNAATENGKALFAPR